MKTAHNRSSSRLLIASARLPVAVSKENGAWQAAASPGGLATALRAVAGKRDFGWIGWPGATVDKAEQAQVSDTLAAADAGIPVFVDKEELEGWYEELSNRVLWPRFHGLGGPIQIADTAWQHYAQVNQRFAEVIADQARPGDTIWIHDYQLALVPQMLRRKDLDCAIGFFLHIPFPSSDVFRTLPVREAILRGLLGADFLGFHAYEYVSHFKTSILRVLGLDSEPEHVILPTHHAHFGALPIGIDPDQIRAVAREPEIREQREELRGRYQGRKVILGVDRLDYTKGLPQKLLAFEELLERHPEVGDKVVFIQIASPSRTGVAEYQELKREIDELVGRISGRFSNTAGSPLVYINQHVPREELVPLFQVAEIALVTPLRDGMNLVCLEYVAARDEPGTLILSEFTGAAQCLSGAMLVNPYNTREIADALYEAIEGEPSDVAFSHLQEFTNANTSVAWAEHFLARLEQTYGQHPGPSRRLRVREPALHEQLSRATCPLVLLDYDGTLTPHVRVPEQAAPSRRLLETVRAVAEQAVTYVVSGRPAAVLDTWLGELPIGLVCEHGLSIRHPGQGWTERPEIDEQPLREVVLPVLEEFRARTPGSRIEKKAASLAWHYRGSDPRLGSWRASELFNQLSGLLAGLPYSLLMGSRVIEIRHVDVTKGAAAHRILKQAGDFDLVVCAGNDRTDEDMFAALVQTRRPAVICYVGGLNPSAEYFAESPDELLDQLDQIAETWRNRTKDSLRPGL